MKCEVCGCDISDHDILGICHGALLVTYGPVQRGFRVVACECQEGPINAEGM